MCVSVLVMGISLFSSSTCRWNFVILCLEHELFTPSLYFIFMWSEVDILAPALAAFFVFVFYQAIRALLFISSSSSTHSNTTWRQNPLSSTFWKSATQTVTNRANLMRTTHTKKQKCSDWWIRKQTENEMKACCRQVVNMKMGSHCRHHAIIQP